MALDPTTGAKNASSKKGRKKWAYMRIGYKRVPVAYNPKGGTRAKKTKRGAPVYRWVEVGSSFFRTLSSKGVTPQKFKTSRFKPGTTYAARKGDMRSPDSQDRAGGGTGGGTRKAQGKRGPERFTRSKQYKNIRARDAARAAARKRKKGGSGGGGMGSKRARGTFNTVGQKIGKAGTGSRLARSFADDLAGMQFDPQINDLRTVLGRLGPQQAQNMADLDQWYGQAQALNAQAGTRNAQVTDAMGDAQTNAVARVIESLGGGANAAGGVMGAAGTDQAALIRALGAADEQSHNDLTGLLSQESAGVKRAEQSRGALMAQDYQLQLNELMGQRGQAKSAALMDILQYNNQVGQQTFQNQIAKLQAQAGVAGLGLDLAQKRAQIRATNAQTRAAKQQEGGGGSGFVPWGKLNPRERYDLLQMAVYTQKGRVRSRREVVDTLRGFGYNPNNPKIQSALRGYQLPG